MRKYAPQYLYLAIGLMFLAISACHNTGSTSSGYDSTRESDSTQTDSVKQFDTTGSLAISSQPAGHPMVAGVQHTSVAKPSIGGICCVVGEGVPFLTVAQLQTKGTDGKPLIQSEVIRVTLAMCWTGENTYNFNTLLSLVQTAQLAGIPYTITVVSGKFAPAWMAADGIQTLEMQESRRNGSTPPTDDIFPVPFDKKYHNLLRNNFIPALARVLQPYMAGLVGIAVEGTNRQSEETAMAVQDWTDIPNVINAQQLATAQAWKKWQSVGYTQQLILAATKQITAAWSANFPGVKLMVYTLTNQAFFADDGSANETVSANYLQWLSDTFGNRVVLAHTYLNYTSKLPNYSPIYGTDYKVIPAMQCAQVLYQGIRVSDEQIGLTFNPSIQNGITRFECFFTQIIQNNASMTTVANQIPVSQ